MMITLTQHALDALAYFDRHPQSHGWKEERNYITHTGVVTDCVDALMQRELHAKGKATAPWHKYEVLHKGRVYPTTAKSEAAACNFIRFKLYGLTPAANLPPFSARFVCDDRRENTVAKMQFTKAQVAERLARMAKSA